MNFKKIADTSFKSDEKCFSFHVKRSFRSQDILIFVPIFLVKQQKRLDKNVNFKDYNFTDWETNCPISQEVKAQPFNEIWSVNRK